MVPPRYNGTSMEEALARIRDTINLVIREYGKHPCAVPSCPCMVHRLGLPQVYEITALLERVKRYSNGTCASCRRRPSNRDIRALHRARQRLVNHRTALISQMRGLLLDRGIAMRYRLPPHGD